MKGKCLINTNGSNFLATWGAMKLTVSVDVVGQKYNGFSIAFIKTSVMGISMVIV